MTSTVPNNIKKLFFFSPVKTSNKYQHFDMSIPLLCKFDRKCNGNCHINGLQLNHTGRKYCVQFNCKNIECRLNHPILWKGLPNISDISELSCDYAHQIYVTCGINIIRQIVFDNYDLNLTSTNLFYKSFEREIEIYEQNLLEKEDLRFCEVKRIQEEEQRKKTFLYIKQEYEKSQQLKKEREIEKIKLGKIMVNIYINSRNDSVVQQQFKLLVKEYFSNKIGIINIIENFLGNDNNDNLVIPTFINL